MTGSTKVFQAGLVAAVAMISASAAFAQPTVDGQVQTITIHCTGVVPDTRSGVVDVLTGAGAGYATRLFIPAGTKIAYGSARVPVTAIEAGDRVRINYTAAASGNTATAATIINKPGAGQSPDDRMGGF